MRLPNLQYHPLVESKRALASVLSNIYVLNKDGEKRSFSYGDDDGVTEAANKITQGLKREDRVIWASRMFLKMLLLELKTMIFRTVEDGTSEAENLFGEETIWPPEMEKKLRKLDWISLVELPQKAMSWNADEMKKAGIPYNMLSPHGSQAARDAVRTRKEFTQSLDNNFDGLVKSLDYISAFSGADEIVDKIQHYIGIGEVYADREPNNPVLAYQFGKQPFSKVVRDLGRRAAPLQRKYQSTDVEEGETIVDLPGGWKWVILDAAYCRKEGKAMGHCGNTAGSNPNDRVLSLREPAAEGGWKPHLTFILNKNGVLGEMKGRNNSKPTRKYHEAIIALLRQRRVSSVGGGGYKPQNNFHLHDLTPDQQAALYTEKPSLFSVMGLSPAAEAILQNAEVQQAARR
jgi:hypothetical protein